MLGTKPPQSSQTCPRRLASRQGTNRLLLCKNTLLKKAAHGCIHCTWMPPAPHAQHVPGVETSSCCRAGPSISPSQPFSCFPPLRKFHALYGASKPTCSNWQNARRGVLLRQATCLLAATCQPRPPPPLHRHTAAVQVINWTGTHAMTPLHRINIACDWDTVMHPVSVTHIATHVLTHVIPPARVW